MRGFIVLSSWSGPVYFFQEKNGPRFGECYTQEKATIVSRQRFDELRDKRIIPEKAEFVCVDNDQVERPETRSERKDSMKGKQAKIDAAFGRLADMIQSGHLLAGTDPVGFLDTIATELEDLRAENVKLRDRISELEACIRQTCHNALDLGYCDMRDCHDCKTFKVCGVEE